MKMSANLARQRFGSLTGKYHTATYTSTARNMHNKVIRLWHHVLQLQFQCHQSLLRFCLQI